MSTLISIKNNGNTQVVANTLRIVEEGRQLLPNGQSVIEPGEVEEFLLSPKQTLRLEEYVAPVADDPTPAQDEAAAG